MISWLLVTANKPIVPLDYGSMGVELGLPSAASTVHINSICSKGAAIQHRVLGCDRKV